MHKQAIAQYFSRIRPADRLACSDVRGKANVISPKHCSHFWLRYDLAWASVKIWFSDKQQGCYTTVNKTIIHVCIWLIFIMSEVLGESKIYILRYVCVF